MKIYGKIITFAQNLNPFKNHEKFKDGIIVNDKQLSLDKDVRNVQIWEMENLKTKDYTQLYWTNFFACYFKKALKDYIEFLNLHIRKSLKHYL